MKQRAAVFSAPERSAPKRRQFLGYLVFCVRGHR
jgi:hypothetical protein